ncbi:MAG: hypothetical protein HPY45_09225 [Anaerolineae bacterium]|nr:hypothetical protein [Anaerolineae bacterium]
MKTSRSFALQLLIYGLLASALFGFLRLQQSIAYWQRLAQLDAWQAIYRAVSGAVCAALSLSAALSLWRGLVWSVPLTRWGVLGLFAWYWLERLLLWRSEVSQVNQPFCAALSVICLLYTLSVLGIKDARLHFSDRGANHERTGN